jgi:hypothetical protein
MNTTIIKVEIKQVPNVGTLWTVTNAEEYTYLFGIRNDNKTEVLYFSDLLLEWVIINDRPNYMEIYQTGLEFLRLH